MTENRQSPAAGSVSARDGGTLFLVTAGLAAAFGAASCCALPLLLGTVGIGSAWLATVAWVAAPHRVALLVAAIVFLAAGGAMLFRRRRAAACAPGAVCGRPVISSLLAIALLVGGALVVLGYVYA